MVETGGLENRCTGNRTGGSNPSPSATTQLIQKQLAILTGRLVPPYLVSSGAQVEHNKAEDCLIAAIASGDAVLM